MPDRPKDVGQRTKVDSTDFSAAGKVLDLSEPVGLTSIAPLHNVTDADDGHGIMARLMTALPSGVREKSEVERFAGLGMVDPGVVPITEWRPAPDDAQFTDIAFYGGLAVKP